MTASTSHAPNRYDIYRRLQRRNRVIDKLRWAVPAVGLFVFAILVGQIVIDNLAGGFLPQGVRIEKKNVIIDSPTYSGVMNDGTRYAIVSQEAKAAIDAPDLIDLRTARIDLDRPSGQQVVAQSETARFSFSSQKVEVPGQMFVTTSDDIEAVLMQTEIDWSAQTMQSDADVRIVFADGSVLIADDLAYDGSKTEWAFTNVTLTVAGETQSEPEVVEDAQ